MRTWLVLAAVTAVVVAATTDTLRGRLTHASGRPAATGTAAARIVPPGVDGGFMGALYYSDPNDDCRLHAVDLPGFARVSPPSFRGCTFALSPDGRSAAQGDAVWQPQAGLVALPEAGAFVLASPVSEQTQTVQGTAPAFKPDGTLTYIRNGAVVEWTNRCGPGARLFTLPADNGTARCRRVIDAGPAAAVTWLTNTRFVVARRNGFEIRDRLGVVASQTLDPRDGRPTLESSPRGTYFTLWMGGRLFAGYDRRGRQIFLPPLPDARTLAWAPTERWAAVVTRRGSVYVFRANTGDARLRRLDFEARDLAWR
jgi:hypothetical protein